MDYFIQYFYNMDDIRVIQQKKSYVFTCEENIYVLSLLKRTPEELHEIIRMTSQYDCRVDTIIENRNGEYITIIYDKMYVLIRKNYENYDVIRYILEPKYITSGSGMLDRSNWLELWSKKIDNIEYQMRHIMSKFPLVSKSINYFIGMAENGISYIRKVSNNEGNSKVISHIRISKNIIFDPQNIIIDNEARDVCEYLKYVFIMRKREYRELSKKLFQIREFSDDTMIHVYGRMFFFTYFFDLYDQIINNDIGEEKINDVISRTEEYEDYIRYIYGLICQTKKIPNIDWA